MICPIVQVTHRSEFLKVPQEDQSHWSWMNQQQEQPFGHLCSPHVVGAADEVTKNW
jgi:hypothetical protein